MKQKHVKGETLCEAEAMRAPYSAKPSVDAGAQRV